MAVESSGDKKSYKVGDIVDGLICTGSKVVYSDDNGFVQKYKWKKHYPRSSQKERDRRVKQMKKRNND